MSEIKIKYIDKWDQSWEKNKDKIVEHTIWKFLIFPDTKEDIDKLLVTKEKIGELTKTPTTIINKLIANKVLIKFDNSDNTFVVNQKKAYCKYCQYKNQKDNYLGNKDYEDPHKEFFEWEINDHLERFHHMNTADYNKITQEVINDRILFNKPKFQFKEHKFTVKEIETRPTITYVTLICEVCKEEHTIRTDLEPCNNYNEVKN